MHSEEFKRSRAYFIDGQEFCCFFFVMIRRPPRSTPFPTRRSSDLLTIGTPQFRVPRVLLLVVANFIFLRAVLRLSSRGRASLAMLCPGALARIAAGSCEFHFLKSGAPPFQPGT